MNPATTMGTAAITVTDRANIANRTFPCITAPFSSALRHCYRRGRPARLWPEGAFSPSARRGACASCAFRRVLVGDLPDHRGKETRVPKEMGALAGAREEKGELFEWEKLSVPISARRAETLAPIFDAQCISFAKQKKPRRSGAWRMTEETNSSL